jgi:rhodanese-related sulfurtransferase
MIRSFVKRVIRKALGQEPSAPPREERRWQPPPPGRGGDGHDHGHSHDHGGGGHDHGHAHDQRDPGDGHGGHDHAHAHDHGGRGHDHGHSHAHDAPDDADDLEIESEAVPDLVSRGAFLLDIREPQEIAAGHATGALLVPMNQVPNRLSELPNNRPILVYCAAGGRSYGVAGYLREQGYGGAVSLVGGFGALVEAKQPWQRPPNQLRFPLTARVRITREDASVAGVPIPDGIRHGTVQAAELRDGEVRYTVQILDEAGIPVRVPDLREADLARA